MLKAWGGRFTSAGDDVIRAILGVPARLCFRIPPGHPLTKIGGRVGAADVTEEPSRRLGDPAAGAELQGWVSSGTPVRGESVDGGKRGRFPLTVTA